MLTFIIKEYQHMEEKNFLAKYILFFGKRTAVAAKTRKSRDMVGRFTLQKRSNIFFGTLTDYSMTNVF